LIRFIHLLCRRFATCLAVAAALAFVADGALGAGHHLGAAPASGGHYHVYAHHHAHAHSHSHAGAAGHQRIHGDIAEAINLATVHDRSAPASSSDAGCCCFCACCAAIVLPSLNAQAAPFVLLRTMATLNHRHGDGVVPDGLRRPPRPTAIT
jgi:hypothetical protein